MNTLLSKIAKIRAKDTELVEEHLATERNAFYEIAMRDFLGKSAEDDAERLMDLLPLLDRTEADYAKTVAGIGTVCAALAAQAVCDAKAKTHEQELAEARRQMLTTTTEAKKWQRRVNQGAAFSSRRSTIGSQARMVREEYPELFDDNGDPVAFLQPKIEQLQKQQTKAAKQSEAEADARADAELNDLLQRQGLLSE